MRGIDWDNLNWDLVWQGACWLLIVLYLVLMMDTRLLQAAGAQAEGLEGLLLFIAGALMLVGMMDTMVLLIMLGGALHLVLALAGRMAGPRTGIFWLRMFPPIAAVAVLITRFLIGRPSWW